MANKSKAVTLFIDEKNHPFRKEIEQLLNCGKKPAHRKSAKR